MSSAKRKRLQFDEDSSGDMMSEKEDLHSSAKTGRVRKKSAKVLEMEEFEEEERKHSSKNVKNNPDASKVSKTQSSGTGLTPQSSSTKKNKTQSDDMLVSPPPMSSIAAGDTSKIKTSPAPITESQAKIKAEVPQTASNVESSTKGQLAAKLKGQIITPPKKQTVQYLVEAAKIKQASTTETSNKSSTKSPLPAAAKSSLKSPLTSAAKSAIKSPLPLPTKSSITSPLPTTKSSMKSPLSSTTKSTAKSPLPTGSKSSTKSPILSPTKSPCISPESPETKSSTKSSVIKLLLNQPAQMGTGASVIKSEPSSSPSNANTSFPIATAVDTPKSTKEKKSKSTVSVVSAKSTSAISESADSIPMPPKKSVRQKAKKSQSVLAAALAAAPTSKLPEKESGSNMPISLTEKDLDTSGSKAKIKKGAEILSGNKPETDIPKLKLLLGSTEVSSSAKQGLHVISPSKQGLKVMSPTGIRQSLQVLNSSKQLSIDTSPATETDATAQGAGLKMKFILSPREKDSSSQSSVMISPNITGQTISPSAKSQMTLEERLQQAAIGMKPKKSKKKKNSETISDKSMDAETSVVSSSQKRKISEVTQGTSTEIEMPSKKKTKVSKKMGEMQSMGCNTEIYVKPSMIKKEVTSPTPTVIKKEATSPDNQDSFHDDEEESALVIAEKKPKLTKKLMAKKKIKSEGSKSSLKAVPPIPQSAMLKQVQSDNTVKVSDASVITKEPGQVKRSEKTKKEKKVKDDDVEKPPKKKKRPPTAYTMWCNQHRAKIVSDNPGIDFAQLSRRLGEIWQGLPAKEKLSWKRKAKRIAGKGSTMISTGKNKRVDLFHATKSSAASGTATPRQQSTTPKNAKTSDEVVPSPVKGLGAEPVDVAAHLKLLGESLSIIGMRLQEHKGLIAVQGSLSVLLDSMLCACGPLMCLTSQVPELNGCSSNTHLNTLDNIAYYMPGL